MLVVDVLVQQAGAVERRRNHALQGDGNGQSVEEVLLLLVVHGDAHQELPDGGVVRIAHVHEQLGRRAPLASCKLVEALHEEGCKVRAPAGNTSALRVLDEVAHQQDEAATQPPVMVLRDVAGEEDAPIRHGQRRILDLLGDVDGHTPFEPERFLTVQLALHEERVDDLRGRCRRSSE